MVMKHNVRINGQITGLDFDLGSEIRDKNGRFIFEGDTVKNRAGVISEVYYYAGVLVIDHFKPLYSYVEGNGVAPDLEIIDPTDVDKIYETGDNL